MTTARDRPPEEAAEDTSFARGLRLLLTVADRGEVRADELGTTLDMPLSTVYRYLRTLGDFGFVDRNGGQFQPRCFVSQDFRKHLIARKHVAQGPFWIAGLGKKSPRRSTPALDHCLTKSRRR